MLLCTLTVTGVIVACTGHMRELARAREAREKEAEAREKEAEARKSKSTPAEFIPDSVIRIW